MPAGADKAIAKANKFYSRANNTGVWQCHLADVDAAVEGPHRLEIFLHSLLEMSWNVVSAEEVFEVARLGLVDGSPSVHSLYDRGHVTKHQRVHQCYTQRTHTCCNSLIL